MSKPMTLSADLFTPQHGFERGVIVEVEGLFDKHVQRVAGYFLGMSESDYFIEMATAREATFYTFLIEIDTIKSITLLTGPMRFWSGAPGWAGFCAVHKSNGHINYYTGQDEVDRCLVNEGVIDHYDVTARAWWCDFGKGAEGEN